MIGFIVIVFMMVVFSALFLLFYEPLVCFINRSNPYYKALLSYINSNDSKCFDKGFMSCEKCANCYGNTYIIKYGKIAAKIYKGMSWNTYSIFINEKLMFGSDIPQPLQKKLCKIIEKKWQKVYEKRLIDKLKEGKKDEKG